MSPPKVHSTKPGSDDGEKSVAADRIKQLRMQVEDMEARLNAIELQRAREEGAQSVVRKSSTFWTEAVRMLVLGIMLIAIELLMKGK